jgi:DNA-binding SARP family transcriptional activator/tetratricopeptide (TPR) repeat protein
VIYHILGELEIWNNGERLALPTGHRLTVLAILLVNANRRVSSAELLRAVWGSVDVDETQLHKSISHLRALLERMGRREDLQTHQRYGYELRVGPEDLDMLVFERLVRQAEVASAERRAEDEIELLYRALRLWTGPRPLAGVPGEAVRREAAPLEQRRKRAAVRLFDLELARGRAEHIIDELYPMVGSYPTDRRLCEQLMLALYRSGQPIEALAVYDRHASALEEAAGTKPEAGLRSLMYAIASADETLVAQYEPNAGAGPPAVVPRQLPIGTADFVGRDECVAEGAWLLSREQRTAAPVVVVTGPGGVGKTALAIHIAHRVAARYPGGQLFLELSDAAGHHLEPEELLGQVLRAFGVTTMPEGRAERAGLYRTLVGERRVLLVLDDARDEAQIRDLVPGYPGCAVLVTSRRRLPDIDGVHHLPTLGPLDAAQATEMFHRVVRRSGVDPYAEPEATRRLVELCAGLPLALSIVAALRARDPGRTTADIVARLQRQSVAGFVYGDRSVARSIGVGFDRLDPHAQTLFLGLGLLKLPDFAVWTAAAILDGSDGDSADVLLRLAGSHMIQPAGAGMRYRFHDLTRQYARHRAEQAYPPQQRLAVVERVYATLLTLVRRAHRDIYCSDFDLVHGTVPDRPVPDALLAELDRDSLAWYEGERLNIRAVVRHAAELGLDELCWDLAASSHEFYTLRRYLDDWHATHRVALEACRAAGNARGEAATLVMLGQPALVASRQAAAPSLQELSGAVDVFERLQDQHGLAVALRTLGNGLRRMGQLEQALACFTRALRLYEASPDPVGRWQALRYVGQAQLDLGNATEALRVLLSAQQAARQADRPRLLAQSKYWIGQARLALGELTEATGDFQYVLDTVGDSDVLGRAYAIHGLGEAALRAGRLDEAEAHLSRAASVAGGVMPDDSVLDGRIHRSLAELRRRQRRPAEEIEALRYAVACFERGHAAHEHADALAALGDAYAGQGATDRAREAWTRALSRYAELRLPQEEEVRRRLGRPPR